MGNSHREQCIGLLTDRMGMGDRRVLPCPLGNQLSVMVGSEDAQRADPHHRAVGLAVRIGTTPQTTGDGHTAIEGTGVQPKDVRFSGFIGIIPSLIRQHAGQQQRHLGIVGRLAGNRVPSASVGKFPDAARVFPPDVIRSPKLDQAAKGISCKLAKQRALGAGEYIDVEEVPAHPVIVSI